MDAQVSVPPVFHAPVSRATDLASLRTGPAACGVDDPLGDPPRPCVWRSPARGASLPFLLVSVLGHVSVRHAIFKIPETLKISDETREERQEGGETRP